VTKTRGGATVAKVGVQFRERSERNCFLTPHLWLFWGAMKQDIPVFFTATMTFDLD